MNSTANDPATVPPAIAAYQAAHDRRDVATALARFAHDATVVDDGRTYVGRAGVESFLSTAASEYTYPRTLVSANEVAADHWRVTNHLEGDFPGGQVDLSYEFRMAGGFITRLVIAP